MSSGDGFEMTGGYWFAAAPADCNEDGGVNLQDIADIGICLTGPESPASPDCQCFDVNGSDTVDLVDFAEAQVFFSGS